MRRRVSTSRSLDCQTSGRQSQCDLARPTGCGEIDNSLPVRTRGIDSGVRVGGREAGREASTVRSSPGPGPSPSVRREWVAQRPRPGDSVGGHSTRPRGWPRIVPRLRHHVRAVPRRGGEATIKTRPAAAVASIERFKSRGLATFAARSSRQPGVAELERAVTSQAVASHKAPGGSPPPSFSTRPHRNAATNADALRSRAV